MATMDLFTPAIAEQLVRKFIDNNGIEVCSKILIQLQRCIDKGQNAIQPIELLIKDIQSLQKCMAITKTGGALVQLGGITGMGLGLLGVSTGGIGLLPLLAITYAAVSVTGGSQLLEDRVIQKKVQEVEKYLSGYQEAVTELKQYWDQAEAICKKISIEESLAKSCDVFTIFSYFCECLKEMKPYMSKDELWTAIKVAGTSVSSDTVLSIIYIVTNLPYAVCQLHDSFHVLFKGKKHEIVQKIEKIQLPELKSQINKLKTAENAFARAQNNK